MATAQQSTSVLPDEDVELLRGSVKAGNVALFVIAVAAIVGLLYLLKLVFITVFFSALLAFAMDPAVVALGRLRVPRPAGAALSVTILLALCVALTVFFYNRALDFVDELPKISAMVRVDLQKLGSQARRIENSTNNILPSQDETKPIPVKVEQNTGLTRVTTGASHFVDFALAITFTPFLIYFMLTWKPHVLSATLLAFPKDKRLVAHRTLGRISEMVRSFIAGNLFVGLLTAIASTIVFWAVHLPYFYFLGPISAFVGLVPYLGIFFALLAPLAAGIGVLNRTELSVVVVSVILFHLISMNVLYPKLIGRRLRLNPLAVALSLLFWAWIWGAFGLVLAIPLMGATKIICDYIEPLQPLGHWLGD